MTINTGTQRTRWGKCPKLLLVRMPASVGGSAKQRARRAQAEERRVRKRVEKKIQKQKQQQPLQSKITKPDQRHLPRSEVNRRQHQSQRDAAAAEQEVLDQRMALAEAGTSYEEVEVKRRQQQAQMDRLLTCLRTANQPASSGSNEDFPRTSIHQRTLACHSEEQRLAMAEEAYYETYAANYRGSQPSSDASAILQKYSISSGNPAQKVYSHKRGRETSSFSWTSNSVPHSSSVPWQVTGSAGSGQAQSPRSLHHEIQQFG